MSLWANVTVELEGITFVVEAKCINNEWNFTDVSVGERTVFGWNEIPFPRDGAMRWQSVSDAVLDKLDELCGEGFIEAMSHYDYPS